MAHEADQRPPPELTGGARGPAELLDQLRQRLDRLGDNHPSSPRESPAGRQRGAGHLPGPRAGGAAPPPDAASAGRSEAANLSDGPADATKESAATDGLAPSGEHWSADNDSAARNHLADSTEGLAHAGERESADDDSAVPADEQSWADGEQEAGDGSERLGESDTGQPAGLLGLGDAAGYGDAAETYRPWFMSQDDSVPWFAADPGRLG